MHLGGVFSTFSTYFFVFSIMKLMVTFSSGLQQRWAAFSAHKTQKNRCTVLRSSLGAAMFTSAKSVRHRCRGCILVCGGLLSNTQLWSSCALFLKQRSCSGKWMELEQRCCSPAQRGTCWPVCQASGQDAQKPSLWRVFVNIPRSQVCHKSGLYILKYILLNLCTIKPYEYKVH